MVLPVLGAAVRFAGRELPSWSVRAAAFGRVDLPLLDVALVVATFSLWLFTRQQQVLMKSRSRHARSWAPGDHVVVNPIAPGAGTIGSGGRSLAIVPDEVPFHVAALNEPMAVARHAVNRTNPKPGANVVVFGAGPIGLGATIGYN